MFLHDGHDRALFARFRTRADKAETYLKVVIAHLKNVVLDNQRGDPMTKPIPDKAEIALEYPDKLYIGTFERSSRFEAHLDPTGIALILEHPGADDVRKTIHMHINFGLFADILREVASTVGRIPKDDVLHHDQLTARGHRVAQGVGWEFREATNKNHRILAAEGGLIVKYVNLNKFT